MNGEGYILAHEHMTIDLSGVKKDEDCRLYCYEQTLAELKELAAFGITGIIDVTNMGMGRNMEYLKNLAGASGIHIYPATGFYKEPFLPEIVYKKTVNELAAIMIAEIQDEIEDSGLKAMVIGEIGTSLKTMTPPEEKIFAASALAAKETGRPIYTHTTLGTLGLLQAEYLLEKGIAPEKIIIGHMDLTNDVTQIERVLQTGVTVGFDTIGKKNYVPEADRVRLLVSLAKAGYLKQIVLSMDLTRKSHLASFGGIGYSYLFKEFLPLLRREGMTEAGINQMLIKNPRKFLGI